LTLAIIAMVIAGLSFGREILVPLALAMLVSFALAPLVRWLRRWRVPNPVAVLASVTLAFLVVFAVGWVVAGQGAELANRLPAYQRNIESKIDTVFEDPPGGRLLQRAATMVRDLGRKVAKETDAAARDDAPSTDLQSDAESEPLPVVVYEPDATAIEFLRTIVGPLVRPLATAGIVIVFVIFMLLKRDDLRDRLIRLAGPRDLSRTTKAMDDAARRVGRYLLMQLVVNITYAVPIGLGVWLIGVPNPILWAILCAVLRFVPYIGPIIAAFFPLTLAVAVDQGWSMFLLTGSLFLLVELTINNVVEPWLYGTSTSLSPLAILAAAVFWTWLWGPIGLLLSTPLTVCLVVLGRNVPQFAFLDVLLGSEPVLAPAERLYKHLLIGRPDDATEDAERGIRETQLSAYLDNVVIPALALAESDRARGMLDEDRVARVAASALVLSDNLSEWEGLVFLGSDERRKGEPSWDETEGETDQGEKRPVVVCAGARGALDDAAAAMLGLLLEKHRVALRLLTFESLQRPPLRALDLGETATVVLSYLNADSLGHARFLVKRLRRHAPDANILVGLWTHQEAARRDLAAATGADHVATSLGAAAEHIFRQLKLEEETAYGGSRHVSSNVQPLSSEPAAQEEIQL
jgi:predicted PurR-regulated permease PerM